MGFIKGGSWGSCEPLKTPWQRVCVGANLAYAMTLFAFDSVILIIVNTHYHNVDPAFLVYYVLEFSHTYLSSVSTLFGKYFLTHLFVRLI